MKARDRLEARGEKDRVFMHKIPSTQNKNENHTGTNLVHEDGADHAGAVTDVVVHVVLGQVEHVPAQQLRLAVRETREKGSRYVEERGIRN